MLATIIHGIVFYFLFSFNVWTLILLRILENDANWEKD